MEVITTLTVSPSPRELVARLSIEEKIAIDLILAMDQAAAADVRFAGLVPDEGRRHYLMTLANQLRQLGIAVLESSALDAQMAAGQAALACWQLRIKRVDILIVMRTRARMLHLGTLAFDARRAVERHARRQRRRGAR